MMSLPSAGTRLLNLLLYKIRRKAADNKLTTNSRKGTGVPPAVFWVTAGCCRKFKYEQFFSAIETIR